MTTFVPVLGTSLLVTIVSAPVVRRILAAHGVFDRPNERSSHAHPVVRGGGLACALGLVAGTIVAPLSARLWFVVTAALALGAVGLADDRLGLSALPRIVSQIIVGLALGWALGTSVTWMVVGALVMTVAVNVANFMDGINGITGMTVGLWGLTCGIAGVNLADPALASLGAGVAGAALGFLPWNIPRAQLFLGDVGSYLLGAGCASGVLMVAVSHRVWLPVVIAPLSIHLVDAGWALLQRVRRGAPLTQGHRDHVYQRLVDACGFSHVRVSAFVAGLAALVTAAWATLTPTPASLVTGLVCFGYVALPRMLASRDAEVGT
jgi:UDP-N-acetylmuramyl pentapeptide phosphotransferase/UDP-N-acetylglucosamine-1-phosphate transferase